MRDMVWSSPVVRHIKDIYTSYVRSRMAKKRSDEIDRHIEEESLLFKKQIRVLLLGMKGSGKSTIMKQMTMHAGRGLSQDELWVYRNNVYKNLIESAQAIVLAVRRIGIESLSPDNHVYAERISHYAVDPKPSSTLDEEIAFDICQLLQDSIVRNIINDNSKYHVSDDGAYFLDEVLRVGSPDYMPTTIDVLRAWHKTTGMAEAKYSLGAMSIGVTEFGGQHMRNPRKWMRCFEAVTTIIFCVSLSDYDQIVEGSNRLMQSLELFDNVVNSPYFLRTSIVLSLNKLDLFEEKIKHVPLQRYFFDYTGGANAGEAARYILWRFIQYNRAKLSVYPHLTQATNAHDRIARNIIEAVKETILHNALIESGIF